MEAKVITADQAPRISMMGIDIRVRAAAPQTGGAASVLEQTAAPGAGSPPHTVRQDKVLCVQRGTFEVLLGNEKVRLEAGATAFIPAGVVHCFRNVAETPSTLIMILLPGGHEAFLRDLAAAAGGGQAARADLAAVAERHGVALLGIGA